MVMKRMNECKFMKIINGDPKTSYRSINEDFSILGRILKVIGSTHRNLKDHEWMVVNVNSC